MQVHPLQTHSKPGHLNLGIAKWRTLRGLLRKHGRTKVHLWYIKERPPPIPHFYLTLWLEVKVPILGTTSLTW